MFLWNKNPTKGICLKFWILNYLSNKLYRIDWQIPCDIIIWINLNEMKWVKSSVKFRFYSNVYCFLTVYHVPRRGRRGVDPFDSHKAWQEHLDRLAAIDRLYPSRYGLYLKDRAYPISDLSTPVPSSLKHSPLSLKGLEYEPDNKPHWGSGKY